MNENEPEVIDSQDDTETTENEGVEEVIEETIEEAEPETEVEDETETLRKEVETLKAQKEHWREKAEKKVAVQPKAEPTGALSSKDLIALMKGDVHEDDVDEVVDYAKFKKISIAEALKSTVIRASLDEKREQRKTAEATNVGRTRSGNVRNSEETLLGKARKTGEIPDNRDDLDRMLEHRYKS